MQKTTHKIQYLQYKIQHQVKNTIQYKQYNTIHPIRYIQYNAIPHLQ